MPSLERTSGRISNVSRRLVGVLLGLAIGLCAAAPVTAATVYYVSTIGSDTNPGTMAAPFATVQKAVDLARPGDTVRVSAGTYLPQSSAPDRGLIVFKNSGTPAAPLTVEAVGEVRIKGDAGVGVFRGIFDLDGARAESSQIHDIIIRGFRLENSSWFGIRLNRTENIVVENNYTYNTGGSGIIAQQSRNIVVRGNTIERACISPDKSSDTQEMISLAEVDGFEISHNHIFNGGITGGGNGGEGIDAKTGSRNGTIHHNTIHDLVRLGIYLDGWDRTVENVGVDGNTVFNCAEGIAVSAENGGIVRAVRIYNNVLYNNQANGIIVSAWLKNGWRRDIQIINNTIVHNGFRRDRKPAWGGGISVESANTSAIVVRNNILSENNLWQILINNKAAEVGIDHNLIDGFRNYSDGNFREEKGAGYISGNPLFVDARRTNFLLKTKSPAICGGVRTNAPDMDFDSTPRARCSGVDLGAYELRMQ